MLVPSGSLAVELHPAILSCASTVWGGDSVLASLLGSLPRPGGRLWLGVIDFPGHLLVGTTRQIVAHGPVVVGGQPGWVGPWRSAGLICFRGPARNHIFI